MANTEEPAISTMGDKYRTFLHGDGEENTEWRHGGPPTYDLVNDLFEKGRTKEWPKGSLEEIVQNAVKSWEMELSHKVRLQDFKTINPEKFKIIVNGREGLSGEETLKMGSYNALLKNSLPKEFQYYKAEEETFESSHEVFGKAFPRGFAWEVLGVYSGPPLISFKFRHWGFSEGPFKGHAPTGDLVQFMGMGTLKEFGLSTTEFSVADKPDGLATEGIQSLIRDGIPSLIRDGIFVSDSVDESLKVEEVEIYYDPAELFGGLLKGPPISILPQPNTTTIDTISEAISKCPFSNK